MREIGLNQPVVVTRAGDPRIPVAWEDEHGVAIGFGKIQVSERAVPAVHVKFEDRRLSTAWIERWHVLPVEETPGERLRRKVRNALKELIG